MKYVKIDIQTNSGLSFTPFGTLEARVRTIDTDTNESLYDRMLSMAVADDQEEFAKARMLDGICKLLNEANRII